MSIPLPVLAFLMVFAAIACTLFLLWLGNFILRCIEISFVAIADVSYWMIDRSIRVMYWLSNVVVNTARRLRSTPHKEQDKDKFVAELPLATRLLKLMLDSDEEQEYVFGDLLEEYNQFPSRVKANLWLYKQVITSIFPLIYKTLRSRLAARI
jgi:hypothetical protein